MYSSGNVAVFGPFCRFLHAAVLLLEDVQQCENFQIATEKGCCNHLGQRRCQYVSDLNMFQLMHVACAENSSGAGAFNDIAAQS